ncbi:MAG: tail fiber protein, partial [Lutibacter sp.]|nr:tail fiber protein [Lutibacter sp.]
GDVQISSTGDYALHAIGDSFVANTITAYRDQSGDHAMFLGRAARGSIASPTAIQSGDRMLTISARGYTGSGFSTGSTIAFETSENWSGTNQGSLIDFITTQNGTTNSGVRMRIDKNGNVGIGTTDPSSKLQVNGTVTATTFSGNFNLTTALDVDKDGTNETTIEAAIIALASKLIPAGTIIMSGRSTAPTGYLLCNGATVSRTTYSDLYTAIGDAFGEGDGSGTFHLPDMRGRFARGVDGGAGNDPDRASRTASNTGGNTSDSVGSLQADELKSHKHSLNYPNEQDEAQGFPAESFDAVWASDRDSASGSDAVGNTGGNETRPKNVNLNYFIKY